MIGNKHNLCTGLCNILSGVLTSTTCTKLSVPANVFIIRPCLPTVEERNFVCYQY